MYINTKQDRMHTSLRELYNHAGEHSPEQYWIVAPSEADISVLMNYAYINLHPNLLDYDANEKRFIHRLANTSTIRYVTPYDVFRIPKNDRPPDNTMAGAILYKIELIMSPKLLAVINIMLRKNAPLVLTGDASNAITKAIISNYTEAKVVYG